MSTQPAAAPVTGEVFDLGYQRYEGVREGRWRSRRAVWRDGVRTSLGLGRSTGQKVLPFLFIGLTWLPAVVVIVIFGFVSSFGGDTGDFDGPSFAEYYALVGLTFVPFFAATVAPELLCSDRRDGVLSLYLVRPLSAFDYVAARWLAFLTVTIAVLWFPGALMFGWHTLSADEPLTWLRDNWDVFPRFMAAGVVIAVVLTSVAMTAASFTNRRLYAAIMTLAVLFLGVVVYEIMLETAPGFLGDAIVLVGLLHITVDVVSITILAADPEEARPEWWNDYFPALWLAAVSASSVALLWWRYRTLQL